MRSGILVPSIILFSVLKDNINCDEKLERILDGFPRNIEQAEMLENEEIFVFEVIFVDTPQSICYSRLQNRRRLDDREECNTNDLTHSIVILFLYLIVID